jgi:hypothetical protein
VFDYVDKSATKVQCFGLGGDGTRLYIEADSVLGNFVLDGDDYASYFSLKASVYNSANSVDITYPQGFVFDTLLVYVDKYVSQSTTEDSYNNLLAYFEGYHQIYIKDYVVGSFAYLGINTSENSKGMIYVDSMTLTRFDETPSIQGDSVIIGGINESNDLIYILGNVVKMDVFNPTSRVAVVSRSNKPVILESNIVAKALELISPNPFHIRDSNITIEDNHMKIAVSFPLFQLFQNVDQFKNRSILTHGLYCDNVVFNVKSNLYEVDLEGTFFVNIND